MRNATAEVVSAVADSLGLILAALACLLTWMAREDDWIVEERTIVLMVALFVGGIGLVGLGALIRQAGRNRVP